MLNVTQISGNSQYAAAHYFASGDDYYSKDNAGEWQGKGAAELGLQGSVEQAEFARMMGGQLPNGQRIQQTFDPSTNKKRMALDLTFSAPKSVSMQALVGGDARVLKAHDEAVTKVMEQVEQLAAARRKEAGKTYRERTGNMVIGKFRHEMSRAKDPQLHTHAVVLNMTKRSDGAWRAMSNENIFEIQHELDAMYKAELSQRLKEIGYEIRLTSSEGDFELAHITRQQIEAFSARSQVIEEALANEGKTRETATALEKQIISLATRPRKDERDRATIKQYWLEKSERFGIGYEPGVALVEPGKQKAETGLGINGQGPDTLSVNLPKGMTAAQAVVQYAINHLTEREAVVTGTRLRTVALHRAVGLATPAQVSAEIKRLVEAGALLQAPPTYKLVERSKGDGRVLSEAGWRHYLHEKHGMSASAARQYVRQSIDSGSLVAAEERFTTARALKSERAILAVERDGRGKVAAVMTMDAATQALAGTTLNKDQRSAATVMLTSSNRVVGIQGDAGVGKSYTLQTVDALIKQAGSNAGQQVKVVFLAPYGSQVKSLKQDGLEARTLDSFLKMKDRPLDGGTIVILDEAGVAPTTKIERLLKLVEQAGARVVLMGDTKQTQAIEAGKPFAQLQDAGMQTARISEIQRQEDPELKKAVELTAASQPVAALASLKYVSEIKEKGLRHAAIAADYVSLPPESRDRTLIVSGTNESRRAINSLIRNGLGLEGKGGAFDMLVRVDMTQAQRRFAPSYEPGMVVQAEKDYKKPAIARGEQLKVVEALPGNVLRLVRSDGSHVDINPRNSRNLSVYDLQRNELAVGDVVRINRNDAALDLTNGDRMKVTEVVGPLVRLQHMNAKGNVQQVELVGSKPLHLEHAYVSTTHSAQGLTTDRVLIDMPANSPTTSKNLFYVAISRAKHEARVYTDSLKKLPAAITRDAFKTSAMTVQRARDKFAKGNEFTYKKPDLERSKEKGLQKPTRYS